MNQLSMLRELGRRIVCKKGHLLIRQGEVDRSVYFVDSGLLKAYYATMEGKELIKSFIQPGEFIGSLISCRTGEPSTFNLSCLDDCSLWCVSFSELQCVADSKPKIAELLTDGLMKLAIKKERREFEFLCLSASERYSLMKQREPELVERITQNDIARYLGITPVALSRIKHRKANAE